VAGSLVGGLLLPFENGVCLNLTVAFLQDKWFSIYRVAQKVSHFQMMKKS